MKLLDRLSRTPPTEERMTLFEYVAWINATYGDVALSPQTTYGRTVEPVAEDFRGNVNSVFKRNGPIFALMGFRLALFSQVRWVYQQFNNGRPSNLWSNPSLDLLNGDATLNARMIQDVDLAGNYYGWNFAGKLWRLRPDWVEVGANRELTDPTAEILAYRYHPGGIGVARPETIQHIPAAEVVHWAPIPDPESPWRGMSWLSPVVREVAGDNAATTHKLKFFENGATPNLVFKFPPEKTPAQIEEFKEAVAIKNEGVRNAYKNLYLGGGADVTVVGKDLQQLEFSITQGKGESRLASAAGVPPVLVGFSEGLQAATYSNYGQARRAAADQLLHPLWVSAAAALAPTVAVPTGSRLWYDGRDIPFLRADAADDADIKQKDAITIRQLTDAGYTPESVKSAVMTGDWSVLVHTGLFSVQLQAPGTTIVKQGVAQ